jgi:hypothetical protein
MRDLLNLIENLLEDRTLSASTILKRPGRFEKFVSLIRDGVPFYTVDKEPVIVEPSEADRMEELFADEQFKGTIKLQTDKGEYALSQLLKTADIGGQASTGQEGEELGKESALLKPSQIGITDRDIPANDLGSEIINNSILQSTDYGRVVIEMAQQILNGQPAVIPKEYVKTKIGASILDYAGEYLGVLAMVNGQSRFPRKQGFTEWLGADPSALTLYFPAESNSQLADSFASISNDKTNHKVNISSKGSGGGAPPSVSGLKIPEDIRNNPDYKVAVAFIDLADPGDKKKGIPPKYPLPSPRTVSQVFQAMNLINQYVPDAIPEEFKPFLPWPAKVVREVTDSIDAYKKGKPIALPQYDSLTNKVKSRKGASDGGKLVYVVKEAVMLAVNEKQAIPGFQQVVLNILDMNFVQQYADLDKKTGVMSFATQWPAKLEGKITLESKSGATDPTKGGFSFKLSNEAPKTNLPEPDESLGGAEKPSLGPVSDRKKLEKVSKKLAGQSASSSEDLLSFFRKHYPNLEKPADVGRKKRK